MKRFGILLLVLMMISVSASADLYTQEDVISLMDEAWQIAFTAASQDPVRQQEVTAETTLIPYYDMWNDSMNTMEMDVCSITDGVYTMQYIPQVIGEADENGQYPLYICLHGGGSDTADGCVNNLQWLDMVSYYRDSVKSGIYVAVRGITNNWNLHFDDASYPLYDRLIEDMMVFFNVDPNRVYLLGFSAGGDGVYSIAPRMADRFAAANQSSGHPNGNTLLNTANLPICIQSGIRDTMFSPQRSVVAAAFDQQLNAFREQFGFGYLHKVYIHVPEGHNYSDNMPTEGTCQLVLENPQEFVELMNDPEINAQFPEEYAYAYDDEVNSVYLQLTAHLGMKTTERDTNAVRFVSRYTRNAHPDHLVWDLTARAARRETSSFYWLQAENTVDTGLIYASFDQAENLFDIQLLEQPNGDFSILLHPAMVDFSRPVYVRCGDRIAEASFQINEEEVIASMADTLDRDLSYAARIPFSSLEFGE